jgi:hypothetical protein
MLKKKGIEDWPAPIPKRVAERLCEDDTVLKLIARFLNKYELLCGSINAGVAHEDYAYKIVGEHIINQYKRYEEFIEYSTTHPRYKTAHKTAYCEFKKLAEDWKRRAGREESNRYMGTWIPGLQ